MITLVEAYCGLRGAWMLARRQPAGVGLFDASPDGYWKSFWAAAFVAPAFIILDWLAGNFDEAGWAVFLVKSIAYVIDWTAFPLVMVYISDSLGRWPAYTRYIVAYNWSAVVQIAVLFPAALLAILIPSGPTAMLAQMLSLIMLIYRAYVAHVALNVALPTAAGIVLMDVLLGGLLKTVAERLGG
jgi:hypothetical protein